MALVTKTTEFEIKSELNSYGRFVQLYGKMKPGGEEIKEFSFLYEFSDTRSFTVTNLSEMLEVFKDFMHEVNVVSNKTEIL